MELKNLKMLAFDVDGTILPYSQEELSPEIVEMFKKLKEKNYVTVVATGRDTMTIGSVINVPNIDYFIGANGAFIYDMKAKKIIWDALFNYDEYKKLEKFLLDNKIPFSMMTEDSAFNSKDFNLNNWFLEQYKTQFKDISEIDRDQKLHIVTVQSLEPKETNLVDQFIKDNNLSMEINSRWSKGFFIAPKGINKSSTINVLGTKILGGIDINKNVMVFGDSTNDVHMIQEAAWSVAVEGAYKELKDMADAVAPSVEKNGVRLYLEKLGVI